MRTALLMLAIASTARADDRPKLATVHGFTGVDLVETLNQEMHIHGGDPALVAKAHLNFNVRDGKAHVVVAKKLELLHGYCNDKQKWATRTALPVTGYRVNDWDRVEPISSTKDKATLPAKKDLFQVELAFKGQLAYQACDRFAFAMSLVVDGTAAAVELPLDVIREEPLREPPP